MSARLSRTRSCLGALALTALALTALALPACGGHGALTPLAASANAGATAATVGTARSNGAPGPRTSPAPGQIQHVVIIVQENRSFDNLFQGYPNANTASSGLNSKGQTIPLSAIPFEAKYDVGHSASSWLVAWDKGKLDKFNLESLNGPDKNKYPNPQYGYVPTTETGPYWSMAQQYVLADNMFASDIDGSFVAHQYLIAGQSNGEVNYPAGLWGCTGGSGDTIHQLTAQRKITKTTVPVCQDYQTLADELDAKHLPWRAYSPSLGAPLPESLWNGFAAINHIYNGRDWAADVISPQTNILTDIPAGKLASVTWVTPDFLDSDHALSDSNTGPAWVANVVNAVGQSQFWNTSVIFVVWDDWGGWYDHAAPAQLDFDGLGFRVPMLCISPYAHKGKIAHSRFEFGSILRFVENNFGLGQLAKSDKRATPADAGCLNYAQKPRVFSPIQTVLKPGYFLTRKPSHRPPDDQ
jgi:phospholipase C